MLLLPDLFLAAFIRQQRFLEVKSSFKQNPTLETPDLGCELILVPFEIGKLTHGLTPTGVMVPLFMLFADHSDALREMSPVRRSKPTKRPVRISTFSKKNPAIGTRMLFVPVVLSLVFGLATSTVGTSASAQSAVLSDRKHDTHGQQIRPGESVHSDVDLALVNVSVTDAHDRPITSLERDSFRILEDNIEQEVVNFSSEDVPVSIGVIFDLSGSMANKFSYAKRAAVQFFKTVNRDDEGFLIGFSAHADLLSPFTNNIEELQNRLLTVSPSGSTALLDGLYFGISEMRIARNAKRALLIISDGGDNHSRYSEADIKRLVREADIQLYAIDILESGYHRRTLTELNGPLLLDELTELTGGRAFTVRNPNELSQIAAKIGTELHSQYILGYQPSNKARDARWRKIAVEVRSLNGPQHRSVHAKKGYYAHAF
jgi:Ca-activated chloride channel homolog